MSKSRKITLLAAIAVILVLFIVAFATGSYANTVACPKCDGAGCIDCGSGSVVGSLWALLPPVIAIGLALITKEVYSSLFVGILAGGLLAGGVNAGGFSLTKGIDVIISDGLISAVSGTAGIFIFLVVLGIIVALINKAGGSAAFGRWAKTHIKTRVGAQLATFALGVLIFIDDYFNCLTVGSVMRPVTDSHKVSRAKLAYLIDATAAPICMIAPISSWAAAVSSYLPDELASQEGADIWLFIQAIPYNFYSLLTLVFVVTIVLMKFDYGPMKLHEKNALELGDLYTTGERVDAVDAEENPKGRVFDLIIPIVAIIGFSVFGLMYIGGILNGSSFVQSFSGTDATVGLPWGCVIALIVIVIYFIARKLITFKEAMECIPKGFIAMVPAILILTFATALKNTTGLLGAGAYVKELMGGVAEGLQAFLPAIIFLVACVLSFATGTSWGTFGILIPIVQSMFPFGSELFIIGMSACLAGSVCGDHCSPISDTTIMSSAGAQSNHLNHVSTQMPYAITVAAVSFVMFIIAGLVKIVWICLPLGIVVMIGTLFGIKFIDKKLSAKKAAGK